MGLIKNQCFPSYVCLCVVIRVTGLSKYSFHLSSHILITFLIIWYDGKGGGGHCNITNNTTFCVKSMILSRSYLWPILYEQCLMAQCIVWMYDTLWPELLPLNILGPRLHHTHTFQSIGYHWGEWIMTSINV